MTTLKHIERRLKEHKSYFVKKYKVKRLGIFGSYAYGRPTRRSDIDILVEFRAPIGLEFVDLAEELEKILHHKVDLVSRGAIKPKYFSYVKKDLHYV